MDVIFFGQTLSVAFENGGCVWVFGQWVCTPWAQSVCMRSLGRLEGWLVFLQKMLCGKVVLLFSADTHYHGPSTPLPPCLYFFFWSKDMPFCDVLSFASHWKHECESTMFFVSPTPLSTQRRYSHCFQNLTQIWFVSYIVIVLHLKFYLLLDCEKLLVWIDEH